MFEVPQEEAARELSRLLKSSHACVDLRNDAWSVQVMFGAEPEELGSLLRRVETWVAEHGLGAIRFQLDGRWYVMESGETTWTLEAA